MKKILLLLLLFNLGFSILLLKPTEREVNDGDIIDLGEIGPGQTITLHILQDVKTGGIYDQGGRYEFAKVTTTPLGWSYEDSKELGYPLQVKITAAKDASEGIYYSNITIIDENYGEKLPNINLVAKVKITYDIMELNIQPKEKKVRPKQEATYEIKITNKGTTGDVFRLWTEGTERWKMDRDIYVAPKSTETVEYKIKEQEEEMYTINIKVESHASDIIKKQDNISLVVRSGLFGDYRSTNNGIIVFPIFEGIIYSIAGLIANLV